MLLAGAIAVGVSSDARNPLSNEVIDPYVAPFSASVSLDEINSLNIILNDNDCSNAFFEEVVQKFQEDGIRCTVTKGCIDINQDGCTVITLDQQYSAGYGTVVFAPYDNTRLGHSDSLALSMQTAFYQNGFIADSLSCGQFGFEKDEDGTIHYSVPTDTEKAIDQDKETSFVTISFGTRNLNAEWVAKSIENGLARQKYYLNSYENQTDLVYRANSSDDLEVVSQYFGADVDALTSYNKIQSTQFDEAQAVVNPYVSEMDVFSHHSEFDIDGVKTKAY